MSKAGKAGKAVGYIEINKDTCKGCVLCIDVCPVDVLKMSQDFNAIGFQYPLLKDGCTGCELCALVCPDYCITVYRNIPGKKARAIA